MDKEYLIKKWLNDELSDEEHNAFKQLDDLHLNQEIIESAKYFRASNSIDIEDFDTFNGRYKVNKTKMLKPKWEFPLLRIASVLLIALSIYFTFNNTNTVEIKTLASEKTTIELPDNSVVILNSVSEITYNKRTWENTRSLKLNGEAYFKVAKGKTFDVITTRGTVTVVGTEFNVKQRPEFFYVQCFEGIVSVTSDSISKKLYPGDSFKIYNDSFTQEKSSKSKPNWVDNISSFSAIALKDVLSELERQYNIEITHENINLESLFSGGFTHNNLEDAIISVTQPMNLGYKINSNNRVVLYENKK